MKISDKPLFDTAPYRDLKDPCPVWDGSLWHLYGSAGSTTTEIWNILHATATSLDGQWKVEEFAHLEGLDKDQVAAPAVVYNPKTKLFNMFVQTDFMSLGGTIERLISADGHHFEWTDTLIRSIPNTHEAGIYDPDPAIINGRKYLTYSGTDVVGRPDIYLAKSTNNTWRGPWKRVGKILDHSEVNHHNQKSSSNYEWGLEGSQLLELPNGLKLLNAVCFLPQGEFQTRQRIFFAISENVEGPYTSLGPILQPLDDGWASGENGHGSVILHDGLIHLFYQARPSKLGSVWRYGHTTFSMEYIQELYQKALQNNHQKSQQKFNEA